MLKARPGSEKPEPDKSKQFLLYCKGNYWDQAPFFYVVAVREDGGRLGNSWLESFGEECYVDEESVVWWIPLDDVKSQVELPKP